MTAWNGEYLVSSGMQRKLNIMTGNNKSQFLLCAMEDDMRERLKRSIFAVGLGMVTGSPEAMKSN